MWQTGERQTVIYSYTVPLLFKISFKLVKILESETQGEVRERILNPDFKRQNNFKFWLFLKRSESGQNLVKTRTLKLYLAT